MAQQIHPPIWRLCEPIDGLDSAQVAECLGLDPSKFHTYAASSMIDARDELQLPGGSAELSKLCNATPLTVKCAHCPVAAPFKGLLGQGDPKSGALGGEWVGSKVRPQLISPDLPPSMAFSHVRSVGSQALTCDTCKKPY